MSIQEAVARIPGPVLAVDERLRVVALSPETPELLRIPASEVIGRPCYRLLSAMDSNTGRPCAEGCPLAENGSAPGWAYSRAFDVFPSSGGKVSVGGLLLRCVAQDAQPYRFCFLSPVADLSGDVHFRVHRAIQEIYPAVSGSADLDEVLALSLKALVRATAADAGDAYVLEPETGELALRRRHGPPIKSSPDFLRPMVRSRLPLLGVGALTRRGPDGMPGSYLYVPLVGEGQVLGALGVASQSPFFDVGLAARILFPVAAPLGPYLQWERLAGRIGRDADIKAAPGRETQLRIHCLGPFEAYVDGTPIPPVRFERLKSLTLLKFLASRGGRPVSREALMEVLWPGADPVRVSANLRVVLHSLRRTLEPGLERGQTSSFMMTRGDMVYLESSMRVWTDVEEFDRRARNAARLVSEERAEEALDECHRAALLYRGEYLEDEPYSDWCLFQRERLKEVYINLLKQMASLLADRGDLSGAVESYSAALAADYGREEVHRGLMLVLWKLGRRDEALRQYEVCRRILMDELGAEPAEETNALRKAVLAGIPGRW